MGRTGTPDSRCPPSASSPHIQPPCTAASLRIPNNPVLPRVLGASPRVNGRNPSPPGSGLAPPNELRYPRRSRARPRVRPLSRRAVPGGDAVQVAAAPGGVRPAGCGTPREVAAKRVALRGCVPKSPPPPSPRCQGSRVAPHPPRSGDLMATTMIFIRILPKWRFPHRHPLPTASPCRQKGRSAARTKASTAPPFSPPPRPPSLTGGSTEPGSVADGGRQPPARGGSAGFIPPLPGGTEPERGETAAAAAVPPP